MSTTPQIIKDQEFQLKFRGFDPIEVNAYLDVIADEFFELQERCRLQVDDLQTFHEEREELEQQKASLEASSAEARKMAEELRQSGLRLEQRIALLGKEAAGLQERITTLEQEKKVQAEALTSAEARIHEVEEELLREKAEKEVLGHKIELMEEQQREARKDEVDFKSTLATAQKFCDSLKEKSQQEADQLLDAARTEIEALRQAAHSELSRLPEEIKTLQEKREEVRKVLRTTLESYLQNLDIFAAGEDVQDSGGENRDLFQKIQILEDGSLASEDLAALNMEAAPFSSQDGERELLSVFGGDESDTDNEDDERI
ncbi:MAG: DivIVA domain-containing protein [Proteobacteria bacterium]|nr:DivIVA domain-containing protein [Pseudomonadota bacterium]MBU1648454.1 DivIVA domain-containing protein [Pseudomonadota bacterium]MBU1986326.1 DivIVA domain-containing protein [Pseudomonadota bacterium]